jgi:hypothetical protein
MAMALAIPHRVSGDGFIGRIPRHFDPTIERPGQTFHRQIGNARPY